MADRATKIVDTTATGTTSWVHMPRRDARDEVLVQFEFTSTGSVTLEGTFDETILSACTVISAQTVNVIIPIANIPRLRANISANGSGIKIYVNTA